ncbi:hypothetical protein NQ317_004072 [Molorchus minor]|uniref:Uncharacterized protein n=1 Tax=Molorchus minor TaxID=1323400 RepID=A0ABQ9JNY9_9CUCU|nr:hypothetical protein NQ317_004072 [Molorchus minor]
MRLSALPASLPEGMVTLVRLAVASERSRWLQRLAEVEEEEEEEKGKKKKGRRRTFEIIEKSKKTEDVFKKRSTEGYHSILIRNHPNVDINKFRAFFRLNNGQFWFVLSLVKEDLHKMSRRFVRHPIKPEEKLAITLRVGDYNTDSVIYVAKEGEYDTAVGDYDTDCVINVAKEGGYDAAVGLCSFQLNSLTKEPTRISINSKTNKETGTTWIIRGVNLFEILVYKDLKLRGNTLEFPRSNWNSREVMRNYLEFPGIPIEFLGISIELPGILLKYS